MSTEDFNENDLSEFADLVVALEGQRPEATPEFTERLDAAVADHFPEEWSAGTGEDGSRRTVAKLKDWVGSRKSYLLPVNAGLAGLAVLVIAVGIGLNQGGPGGQTTTSEEPATITDSGAASSGTARGGEMAEPPSATDGGIVNQEVYGAKDESFKSNSNPEPSDDAVFTYKGNERTDSPIGPNAAGVENRKVAQEAEITLGTKPEDVQDVSNRIVETVDDHNGIVLDSQVIDGGAGDAGARFRLMIPSTELESAVADLSGIADLRARNQETEDITAPTLTVQDRLETSKAKVQSLVGQLSEASSEEERTQIEGALRSERGKVSRLTTRLNRLERRANLTPVAVTVETGGNTSPGEEDSAWGIGDALDDAGHMLGIAAGVALIALAIAIPIGILVLIALALNRAWLRRARQRALDEN